MWARKCFAIILLGCLAFVMPASVQAMPEPVVLRLATTPDEPTHDLARRILEKAYARAKIDVEFIDVPFLRSLAQSNSGYLDGEVARLTVIEQEYTNLVAVPVKLYDLSAFAYANTPIPHIKAWQDLKGKRLGLELGVVFTDRYTKGFSRQFASSKRELAMMLKRGAVDIVVHSGLSPLAEPTFTFHRSAALQTESVYHYLHKKHANLVTPIARELQALQDEGVISRLFEEATR